MPWRCYVGAVLVFRITVSWNVHILRRLLFSVLVKSSLLLFLHFMLMVTLFMHVKLKPQSSFYFFVDALVPLFCNTLVFSSVQVVLHDNFLFPNTFAASGQDMN